VRHYATFLLGTVAALCVAGAAQAAPMQKPVTAAQSYAELLEPVDNASAVLTADDLAQAQQPRPLLQLVQYHHHHHHHHHHHGFFPGFGVRIGPPAYYGPDCYIRRQVWYDRYGYRHIRNVRVCD
jgi:hypothetical protein